ncbi:hemolysin family protein (plasmid) [Deinococcus sp. KNUC1210]|uniref:hemolysin family protein n=1 Tax=Deinococcus sp. KNUC1210 TaxID=2917691 RepID=UPI001EEFD96D|nr:hemolysin family protein [Deinococcus sp. KNUC1210]ULH17627.1 hemolysin family protein [Deinococcus sp. KNUC1210]
MLLNGLFVAAEFAVVVTRTARLETMAKQGNGAARWLLGMYRDPTGRDRYIAVSQLGITLASIGLGMYGEPQVAGWLEGPLEHVGLGTEFAHTVGFLVALSIITFLHVVFGEMIPKALALQTPETVSVRVTPLMRVFGVVVRPLVTLLNLLALGLMHLLRIKDPGKQALLYTSKELSILTEESAEGGQLGQVQRNLIHHLFALEEYTAEELMTLRRNLDALPLHAGPEEITARIAQSRRSRYPVYGEHLDDMIGVLHIKDFIRARAQGRFQALNELVRPLPSVPKSATAESLLRLFKQERVHAALVVDEYGGTLGFVTMDDLIRDIVEDDAAPDHDWVWKNEDGSYTVNGEVSLRELREAYALALHHPDVTTIAGLMLAVYGSVPPTGSTVQVQGHDLIAEEVQGVKITRVRIGASNPLSGS